MKLRIVLDVDANDTPRGVFAGAAPREYEVDILHALVGGDTAGLRSAGVSIVAMSVGRRPERTYAPSPLIDTETGEVLS